MSGGCGLCGRGISGCGLHREEDDSYSDDDDISWKVRRAAAKCVSAIVTARPDLLGDFYATVSPALINRFKGMLLPWVRCCHGYICCHGYAVAWIHLLPWLPVIVVVVTI